MKEYLPVMKKSPLFAGIDGPEILAMIDCLAAVLRHYRKNQFIFREGSPAPDTGLVLSGRVHVIKEDFWGNRTILTEAGPGQLFGETYACMQTEPLEVSVTAAEETEVLLLNCRRILTFCSASCEFHNRLVQNLLKILAGKNLMLTRKMEHLSRRTTREKLLSYLSEQSKCSGSPVFTIPFNRQQLADYLSVDRSAMSSELGKMKKEHLIDFEKNQFTLYADQAID